ncbi:MAG: S-layer family protein, partial [Candidatus Hydrogenedentes bacterium]|nr:S-layer family protein [Candidatus Hydrogenedentota bacterium]
VFAGSVNALAPNGEIGNLLLDPRDVTANNGGAATALTAVDEFADGGDGTDVTIDVDTISGALADVTIRANRDFILTNDKAINITNAGIDFLVETGRSILINQNITTNSGFIRLFANNAGADAATRTANPGAAVITMADGTTLNPGGGLDVQLVVQNGPNGNDASGNITIENLTTSGHILIQQLGTTTGSSVVRASADSLITASSVAIQVDPTSGTTASVGTSANPLRVTVTNLEALAEGGGVFIDSPTQGFTVGGAAGGSLTGISTTDNGTIQLRADDLTINEAINAGPGSISIASTNGRDIFLGTAGDATTLSLTETEISQITTSGTLTIGDANTDYIEVNALTTPASVSGSLTLNATAAGGAGGDITFKNAARNFDTLTGTFNITAADTITVEAGTNELRAASANMFFTGVTLNLGDDMRADIVDTTAVTNTVLTDNLTIFNAGDVANDGIYLGNISDGGGKTLTLQDGNPGDTRIEVSGAANVGALSIGDWQHLTFNGNFTTTGAITANNEAGVIDLTVKSGATVTAGGALTLGSQNLFLEGNSTVKGNSVSIGVFNPNTLQLTGSAGQTATIEVTGAANNLTISDNITLSVTTDTDLALKTNGGTVSVQQINVGSGDLTITANDVTLNANVTSTGTITLQPDSDADTIAVGTTGSTFNVDDTEITQLQNGATSIIIGRITGTGGITVDSATFTDPTTLRSPNGGTIQINNDLTGTGNASFTINGSGATTNLASNVTTQDADITFSDNVVLQANVLVDSDSNNDGTDGNITFSGTVNADDATANNRTLTVDADTGTATFTGVIGTTQALADLDVTAATINWNAATVQVDDGAGGGEVTITGASVLGTDLSFDTNGTNDNSINFTSTINGTGAVRNLTVDAGGQTITFGGNVGATNLINAVDLDAATFTMNGSINAQSNVTIDVTNSLTVDNNITAAGTGTISVTVTGANNTLTVDTSADIDTANQPIMLTADHVSFDSAGGTTIGSASETITLQQNTAAATVEFVANATADTNGILRLDDLDLDALANTTGITRIGRTDGGSITVSDSTDVSGDSQTLTLRTSGSISDGTSGAGGNSINVANIALDADTGVDVALAGTTVAAIGDGGADDFFIEETANPGSITVGVVDGITGITNTNGNLTVRTTNGGITVQRNVTIGGTGTITFLSQETNADNGTVEATFELDDSAASPTISTSDGSISITADNVIIDATTSISAGSTTGTDNVTLQPFSANNTISIGSADSINAGASPDVPTLGLTEAELERITTTADSAVVIGVSTNTGGIDIAAAVNLADNASSTNIVLRTGGNVSDSGAGELAESTILFTVTGNFGESSGDKLNINATNLAGETTGTADVSNIFILEADGVTVSDQSAVGGFGLSGLTTSDGDIRVTLTDGSFTLADAVNITANDNGADSLFDIAIDANGAGGNDDVTLNGNVTADNDIGIRASQDILQAANNDFIIGDELVLHAGRDIGTGTLGVGEGAGANDANAIDIRANSVAAASALNDNASSDIFINQDAAGGDLTVASVTSPVTGVAVNGIQVDPAGSGGTRTGGIVLTTEDDNLVVNQAITARGALKNVHITVNDTGANGNKTVTLSDVAAAVITSATGTAAEFITITADNVTVAGTTNSPSIGNSAVEVTFRPLNASTTIELGAATTGDTNTNLTLTDAELDALNNTTGITNIGRTDGGAFTFRADVDLTADSAILHLKTGAGITGTAGGVLVANLAVTAATAVDITDASSDVNNLAAVISGASQAFSFRDTDDLDIDTVDGVSGITTNGGVVTLQTGGLLTQTQAINTNNGGAGAGGAGLRIISSAAVDLNDATNNVSILAFSVTGAGNGLTFLDGDTLAIGTVGATDGGSTDGGTIDIAVTTGGLTVNDTTAGNDLDSAGGAGINGGAITLTANGDNQQIKIDGVVNSNDAGTDGAIVFTADDMDINNSITAGSARVTLQPETTVDVTDTIDLGDGVDSTNGNNSDANVLEIDDLEIERITADTVQIGVTAGTNTGAIAITDSGNNFGSGSFTTLTLITGNTSTTAVSDTSGITQANLRIESVGSVNLDGNNSVTNLSARVTGAGSDLRFDNDVALNITTVDGVSGVATTGGDQGADRPDININAAETTAGDLTIVAANGGVSASGTGRIHLRTITAGSNIAVNEVVTGNSIVVIDSINNITDGEDDTVNGSVRGSQILLAANDSVGSAADPIKLATTDVAGQIFVGDDATVTNNGFFVQESSAGGDIVINTVVNWVTDGGTGTDGTPTPVTQDIDTVDGIVTTNGSSVQVATLAGSITVTKVIDVNGATNNGSITLDAQGVGGNIQINAQVDTADNSSLSNAAITMRAGNNLTVGERVISSGSLIHFIAGDDNAVDNATFSMNGGFAQITSNNGPIVINANEFNIGIALSDTAAINSGSANIIIRPNRTGETIDIGNRSGNTDEISISESEIVFLATTGNLILGSSTDAAAAPATDATGISVPGSDGASGGEFDTAEILYTHNATGADDAAFDFADDITNVLLISEGEIESTVPAANFSALTVSADNGVLTFDADDSVFGLEGGTEAGATTEVAGTGADKFPFSSTFFAARSRTGDTGGGNLRLMVNTSATVGQSSGLATEFTGIRSSNNGEIDLEINDDSSGVQTLTINQPIVANGSGNVFIIALNDGVTQQVSGTPVVPTQAVSNSGNISSTSGNIETIHGVNAGTDSTATAATNQWKMAQFSTNGNVTVHFHSNFVDNNTGSNNVTANVLTIEDLTANGSGQKVAAFGLAADELELSVNTLTVEGGTIGEFKASFSSSITLGTITTQSGGFSATVTATNGTLNLAGQITVANDFDFLAQADNIIVGVGVTVGADDAANQIVEAIFRGNEIDFTSGAQSVTVGTNAGGGTHTFNLRVEPNDVTTNIEIGGNTINGALNLDQTDLAALHQTEDPGDSPWTQFFIGVTGLTSTITISAATNFEDPTVFIANGAGGEIVVNAAIENTATVAQAGGLPGFEFLGSGATTTLNADVTTAGTDIIYNDSVEIDAATVTLDTTNAGAVAGGADIKITGTLDSVSGEENTLQIDGGTGGNVVLNGNVGARDRLLDLRVEEAADVDFDGTIRLADELDIGDDADVDNVTLDGAVTAAGNVTINLDNTLRINSGANFNIDGTFTQAGGGDVELGADIQTSDDAVSFADEVVLTNDATINTGAGGGTIGFTSTVTGPFTLGVVGGTGAVTFTDSVTLKGLTTQAQAYSITLNGASNTFTNAVTFANTGGITLHDGADTTTFEGGVTAMNGGTITLRGTIRSNGTAMTLGNINLAAATTLSTDNTVAAGGDLTVGTVTADAANTDFTVDAGTSGAISINSLVNAAQDVQNFTITDSGSTTVSGSITLEDDGDLILTDTTNNVTFGGGIDGSAGNGIEVLTIGKTDAGTVTFNGSLEVATTFTATSGDVGIVFNGNNTVITPAVTLGNTGGVTFGDANGDTFTFNAGLTSTASTTTLRGTVQSSDDAISLGAVSLSGNATVDTQATTTAGDLVIGAVTGNSHNLTVDTGDVAVATIVIDSLSGVDTLTVRDSGTTTVTNALSATTVTLTDTNTSVTFSGGVTATNFNAAGGQTYSIAFNEDSTITNAVTFSNTSGVTLGNDSSDILTFLGGLTSTASTTTAEGTVRVAGGNSLTLAAVTIAAGDTLKLETNLDAPGGGALTTGAVNGNVTGNLTVNAGTGGAISITSLGATTGLGTFTVVDSGTTSVGAIGAAGAVSTVTLLDTTDTITFTGQFGDATRPVGTLNTAAQPYSVIFNGGGQVASDATFQNTGGVTFGASITFTNGLDTTAGATFATGTITTTDKAMDFGNLRITGNTTLAAGGGQIRLAGTVDGTVGNETLDINTVGATLIQGRIGGTTTIDTLTTNGGGTTQLGADITTSNATVTFNDAVTLTADAAIDTGAGAGNIAFASTLNGAHDLALAAGTGTISFTGAVGGATPLGDGDGAAIDILSGTTTFANTLVTASGIVSQANVVFQNNVTLGAGNTDTALNGTVTFDTLGSTFASAGNVTLGNAAADTVTITTATILDTSAANKNITVNGNLTMNNSLTVQAGTGVIDFNGDISSDANTLTIRKNTAGDRAPSVALEGVDIGTLSVTAHALELGGDVEVNTALDLSTSNVGAITLVGSLTVTNQEGAADAAISLAPVTGNFTLTIEGDDNSAVTLQGLDIDTLTVNASEAGALSIRGDIETDTALDFSNFDAITLTKDVTIAARNSDAGNALAAVTFGANNTIAGAAAGQQALTVIGSTVTFDAAVGGTALK